MPHASHANPPRESRAASPGLDFYRLVERASDLILIVREGRIIYANPAFAQTLGYAPHELVGRPPADIVHPDERASSRARVEQTLREGSARLIERRLLCRDGSVVTIEGSAFATTFEGSPAVVLMGHDLTDRKRANAALQRAARSEAMSAIGSLVAGVAHEVRNPLFGMTATLDALESRLGPVREAEPFLQLLRRELDRLNTLMRELLDYGKPPSAELTRQPLAPVIQAAVRACAPRAEEKNVRIDNAVGDEAGELRMDAARIGQVLQNLVENAVQHTPSGGRVRVEASEGELGGAPSVEVRVLDAGHGFRPDDLPRIFDPFFTRRRGGTGLGLSIVQRITEQHGGTVEAGNRPEGGGVVTVRLPRDPSFTHGAG